MTREEHLRQAKELEFLAGTDVYEVPDPRPGKPPRAVCPTWVAINWHRKMASTEES